MSDNVGCVSVIIRISQRDARYDSGAEAKCGKISKVYDKSADSAAYASCDERETESQVDAEERRFCDAEEYGDEAGDTKLPCLCVAPVEHQISEHCTALSSHGHRHERI